MLGNNETQRRGVVITGGSRGLGRALALEMSNRGARVAIVARGRDALDETVAELRGGGGEVTGFSADISDKRAIHPLAAQLHEYLGRIDLLINAASMLGPTPLRSLLDTECEDLQEVFETNVVGPFRLAKVLLGPMLARGEGAVLNVSSDAADAPYPHWGSYGASKAALDQLGAIWDAELSGQGVRVLSVDPGEMDTKMHADAIPDADPRSLARPEWVARWITEGLSAWLESDAQRHVTPGRGRLSSAFASRPTCAAGGAR